MPTPIEICLEDLDLSPDDERYIRCVALPGGDPGLALDREGLVRWMPDEPADYGLWVSDDDRLILLRGERAGPITVQRGGRAVEAPAGQPVVLLDGDRLRVNGRRLQVHVHGEAEEVYPPEPLSGRALARLARAAAAALALGAAVGAGGEAAGQPAITAGAIPVEVRKHPPSRPAPMRAVLCTVTSIKAHPKGRVMVKASCPEPIPVGASGFLLDAKGSAVEDGIVTVQKAKGKVIEARAFRLKRAVKATTVRLNLRR